VLHVYLDEPRNRFGTFESQQWRTKATDKFIKSYVTSTVRYFRQFESLNFLIQREVPRGRTAYSFAFDGEQELRDIKNVPIDPTRTSTSMALSELLALETEVRFRLWQEYNGSDKVGEVKFLAKAPKSFPRC
jgi:hypothetical protein